MKVALLCSGLGHIQRGHEVFARDLFTLLRSDLDITLFKGGGEPADGEVVIDNLPRLSPLLRDVHVPASPKWQEAAKEQERIRIEGETFAYAALRHLMAGGYDVIHCLEQEVCNVVFDNRHLFAKTPKIVFSNGGAIPAAALPRCDFVQEHTDYNARRSDRKRAFMIPHGVDLNRFQPGRPTDFRARHGIPDGAFLMLSVGTICFWHKRMDHVIRELAPLTDVYLAIVGQHAPDTPAIMALGRELMGPRVVFDTLAHDQLPQAYAAADAFVLGSLFETFGIVYIEAMAMQLPVLCTNHENQRSIVREGIFLDMARPGHLRRAIAERDLEHFKLLGRRARKIVQEHYDLSVLKHKYAEHYARISNARPSLPRLNAARRLQSQVRDLLRRFYRAASATWR